MKNKNDCDDVLKKNEALSSKLDFVLKENHSLKNKIDLISKELDLILNENKSMKNDLDTHFCHASVALPSSVPIACSISSSIIENDIIMLKKSVDCLGSTLSQCAKDHKKLESMFHKKHAPHVHAHHTWHTYTSHVHTHDTGMLMCTLVHMSIPVSCV